MWRTFYWFSFSNLVFPCWLSHHFKALGQIDLEVTISLVRYQVFGLSPPSYSLFLKLCCQDRQSWSPRVLHFLWRTTETKIKESCLRPQKNDFEIKKNLYFRSERKPPIFHDHPCQSSAVFRKKSACSFKAEMLAKT